MKKLWVLLIIILAARAGMAQEIPNLTEKKSFLSFNAGLSIPVICYASTNIYNKFAGFAKPGFTIDLIYGYRIKQNAGISGMLFYSVNQTDNKIVQGQATELTGTMA